jgi:hypothetical protein
MRNTVEIILLSYLFISLCVTVIVKPWEKEKPYINTIFTVMTGGITFILFIFFKLTSLKKKEINISKNTRNLSEIIRNLSKNMNKNSNKERIEVSNSSLELILNPQRVDVIGFRCPFCGLGMFLGEWDETFKLKKEDVCILCGQKITYDNVDEVQKKMRNQKNVKSIG